MWSPNTSYVPFCLSCLLSVERVLEMTDPVLEGIFLIRHNGLVTFFVDSSRGANLPKLIFSKILAVKMTYFRKSRRASRGRRRRRGGLPLMCVTYGGVTISILPWKTRRTGMMKRSSQFLTKRSGQIIPVLRAHTHATIKWAHLFAR